jgi:hypothetical protein
MATWLLLQHLREAPSEEAGPEEYPSLDDSGGAYGLAWTGSRLILTEKSEGYDRDQWNVAAEDKMHCE